MQPWKIRARRVVLECNEFLTVESHAVELPDGRVIDDWPWLVAPDFVNVVAVTEEGRFLCFRQNKYGVDGTSLAPVGGYIEEGEEPLHTAKRELLEETGHEASEWIDLGCYRVDGNRGMGRAYPFLARGARRVAEPDADDLEEQKLLLLTRSELEDAVAAGDFKLLPWIANVLLALRYLED
jgi:8-oxo-dGTP pyrophosphatase MutT (NUDIX family)